jgi:hypothetical protein
MRSAGGAAATQLEVEASKYSKLPGADEPAEPGTKSVPSAEPFRSTNAESMTPAAARSPSLTKWSEKPMVSPGCAVDLSAASARETAASSRATIRATLSRSHEDVSARERAMRFMLAVSPPLRPAGSTASIASSTSSPGPSGPTSETAVSPRLTMLSMFASR